MIIFIAPALPIFPFELMPSLGPSHVRILPRALASILYRFEGGPKSGPRNHTFFLIVQKGFVFCILRGALRVSHLIKEF